MYQWNCGLNVAYVTLRLFQKEVDITALAQQVNAGPYLRRNISFLDIKKTLQRYGLLVEGFKADYPKEIVDFAQPETVLILRLSVPDQQQTIHHFIVIQCLQEYVIIIDPPHRPKKSSRSDIIEEDILSHATGEFLMVYEP